MTELTLTEAFDHSADAVWAVVGQVPDFDRWHWAFNACDVEGEGVGAVRTVSSPDGFTIRQRIDLLDHEHRMIAWSILDEPFEPFFEIKVTLTVQPTGPNACEVIWRTQVDHESGNQLNAQNMVRINCNKAFQSLRMHLDRSAGDQRRDQD